MIFAGVSDHGADQRAFYAKRGIKSWPANKDIWAGLETVRNLMDPAQEGGPRLFVVSNEAGPGLGLTQRDKLLEEAARPTCLQEEMGRYLWGVSKTAAGAKVMKDLPVDANNHGNDWLRYVLHTFTSRRATLVDRTPPGRKRMDEDESLS
jgi:hypothetical protein